MMEDGMDMVMEGIPAPVMTDADLSRSIAGWLKAAPRTLLVGLHDDALRDRAAKELGELIVAELTMSYPELCAASAPRFEF
jgi:hypothetical protein